MASKRGRMGSRVARAVAVGVLVVAVAVPVLVGVPAVVGGPGGVAGAVPVGTITSRATSVSPVAVASGADGNLWFTTTTAGTVGRMTPAGVETLFSDPGVDGGTTNITAGPDGNVWFGTSIGGDPAVGRVTPAGVITTFTDPSLLPIGLMSPGGDGNVWFFNGSEALGRITPDGVVTIVPIGAASVPGAGIALGPDGNLWLAHGNILRVTPEGGVTSFPHPGLFEVFGMAVGPDGAMWTGGQRWSGSQLGRITVDGAFTLEDAPGAAENTSSLARGPDGALWLGNLDCGLLSGSCPWPGSLGRLSAPGVGTTSSDASWPNWVAPTSLVAGSDGGMWFTVAGTGALWRAEAVGASRFAPVTPARLVDSRFGTGFSGPVVAGSPRAATVAGLGGVPASASAVVMNVTVTQGTADSFLTVFPAGGWQPVTSNLNFAAGQTVPNLVTVPVGVGGQVAFANQLGSVQVVADVVGYYDASAPGGFGSLVPARILDSRDGTGGWSTPLGAGESRDLVVAGAGAVPVDATAVVMNVTVTGPTSASVLQVAPAGTDPGETSNLNFAAGQTVGNLVTVGLGSGGVDAGKVQVRNQLGSVDVVADVVGYYQAGMGADFFALFPTRVADSRYGTGTSGAWGPGESRSVAVAGAGGVPGGASGVVANVTVTQATSPSYLTVFPSGGPVPGTANLVFDTGQTVPELAVVGVPPSGGVSVFNQLGTVHVIIDASGWFVPRPVAPAIT